MCRSVRGSSDEIRTHGKSKDKGSSGNYYKCFGVVDPIHIEVAVQGKDEAEAQYLGRNDQRSIREIHGCIGVLVHELPHPPLFGFFTKMDLQHPIFNVLPQVALERPSSKLMEKVHGLSKSRPSCDERQRKGSKRGATLPVLWLVLVYQRDQCPGIGQGHTFSPIFLYFSAIAVPNAFSYESWLGFPDSRSNVSASANSRTAA